MTGIAKKRPRIGRRIKDSENNENDLYSLLRRLDTPSQVTSAAVAQSSAGSNVGDKNALPTAGGTMIGAIAFFPKLISISTGAIDISTTTDDYTSRVIVAPESGSADNLDTITGAEHAGQLLFLQGTATVTITLTNSGNIETIDGSDYDLVDDDNIILIYDSTDAKWQQVTTGKESLNTLTRNLDVNGFQLNNVDVVSFNDDPNNNYIGSIATGISYNVNSTDHHKLNSGGTELMRLDTTDISLGVPLDMNANNINDTGNINFTNSGQVITTDTAGLLYQAPTSDTHDFYVAAVSKFEVQGSKIILKVDTELTGGQILKSSSSTEIGIQVGNEALSVGSEGSMVLPYISNATNSPSDATVDGWFGDVDGTIGIQHYTTAPNYRIWIRANSTWFKAFAT